MVTQLRLGSGHSVTFAGIGRSHTRMRLPCRVAFPRSDSPTSTRSPIAERTAVYPIGSVAVATRSTRLGRRTGTNSPGLRSGTAAPAPAPRQSPRGRPGAIDMPPQIVKSQFLKLPENVLRVRWDVPHEGVIDVGIRQIQRGHGQHAVELVCLRPSTKRACCFKVDSRRTTQRLAKMRRRQGWFRLPNFCTGQSGSPMCSTR